MNPEALIKARRRLEKMSAALEALRPPSTPDAVEAAWEDFIMAAGGLYSALEQGAKVNDKCKAWFGRRKHERKKDPLLRYVHQARNAEEHGIKRITQRNSSAITLGPGAEVQLMSDGKSWKAENAKGDVKLLNDVVVLIPVQDARFGDWFDPPTSHLGQELKDASPLNIAALCLAYAQAMLAEAALFAQ